jgi:hypothetical protein
MLISLPDIGIGHIEKDRETAVKYFVSQYEEALKENLDDYQNNYKEYMGANKEV